MGLVPSTMAASEPATIQSLGAHTVRMEFAIGDPASQLEPTIEAYARVGIRVMPLAGFAGTLPSEAQAKNLATWAAAFGPGGSFWQGKALPESAAVTTIEFGNETSYSYQYSDNSPSGYATRAQTYALRFRTAYEAIHGVNSSVGLLAQADDGGSGSPEWVNNMFKAVPNLASMVAGWTVHPYGPEWQAKMDELVSSTTANGAPNTIPIDVTEWGLASDNGRCLNDNYGWNPCMTYTEAGNTLSATMQAMRNRYGSRLREFYVYQAQDLAESGTTNEREEYFGVLQKSGASKGAYTTTVESLLTANP